jgi:hypothetical protein
VASASEERSKLSYTVNSGEFLPFRSPEDPFVTVLISVSQSVGLLIRVFLTSINIWPRFV